MTGRAPLPIGRRSVRARAAWLAELRRLIERDEYRIPAQEVADALIAAIGTGRGRRR